MKLTTKKLVLNRLKSLIRHFVGKEQVMVFYFIFNYNVSISWF